MAALQLVARGGQNFIPICYEIQHYLILIIYSWYFQTQPSQSHNYFHDVKATSGYSFCYEIELHVTINGDHCM